jgi:hypothetical protein
VERIRRELSPVGLQPLRFLPASRRALLALESHLPTTGPLQEEQRPPAQ